MASARRMKPLRGCTENTGSVKAQSHFLPDSPDVHQPHIEQEEKKDTDSDCESELGVEKKPYKSNDPPTDDEEAVAISEEDEAMLYMLEVGASVGQLTDQAALGSGTPTHRKMLESLFAAKIDKVSAEAVPMVGKTPKSKENPSLLEAPSKSSNRETKIDEPSGRCKGARKQDGERLSIVESVCNPISLSEVGTNGVGTNTVGTNCVVADLAFQPGICYSNSPKRSANNHPIHGASVKGVGGSVDAPVESCKTKDKQPSPLCANSNPSSEAKGNRRIGADSTKSFVPTVSDSGDVEVRAEDVSVNLVFPLPSTARGIENRTTQKQDQISIMRPHRGSDRSAPARATKQETEINAESTTDAESEDAGISTKAVLGNFNSSSDSSDSEEICTKKVIANLKSALEPRDDGSAEDVFANLVSESEHSDEENEQDSKYVFADEQPRTTDVTALTPSVCENDQDNRTEVIANLSVLHDAEKTIDPDLQPGLQVTGDNRVEVTNALLETIVVTVVSPSKSSEGEMVVNQEVKALDVAGNVVSDSESVEGGFTSEDDEDLVAEFMKQGSLKEDPIAVQRPAKSELPNLPSKTECNAIGNDKGLAMELHTTTYGFMKHFEGLHSACKAAENTMQTGNTPSSRRLPEGDGRTGPFPAMQPTANVVNYFATLSPADLDDHEIEKVRLLRDKVASISGQMPAEAQTDEIRNATKRATLFLEAVDRFLDFVDADQDKMSPCEPSPVPHDDKSDFVDDSQTINEDQAISALLARSEAAAASANVQAHTLAVSDFSPQVFSDGEGNVEIDAECAYVNSDFVPESNGDRQWWKSAILQTKKKVPFRNSEDTGAESELSESASEHSEYSEWWQAAPGQTHSEDAASYFSTNEDEYKTWKLHGRKEDLDIDVVFSLEKSFGYEKKDTRAWMRKREMAKRSWLNPLSRPDPINVVAAVKNLDTMSLRKKCFQGLKPWRQSYKERTKNHPGYYDADVFSLYEATDLNASGVSEIDLAPWEHRDVKQRFLQEKSISFSRNWFGHLSRRRGNPQFNHPYCKPKSMVMPIENIRDPGDLSAGWYTTLFPFDPRHLLSPSGSFTEAGRSDHGSCTDGNYTDNASFTDGDGSERNRRYPVRAKSYSESDVSTTNRRTLPSRCRSLSESDGSTTNHHPLPSFSRSCSRSDGSTTNHQQFPTESRTFSESDGSTTYQQQLQSWSRSYSGSDGSTTNHTEMPSRGDSYSGSEDESRGNFWDDPPECGEIVNVKQKIGERVTRVHPDYTSSLRRSLWRKKYFPKGTFPY